MAKQVQDAVFQEIWVRLNRPHPEPLPAELRADLSGQTFAATLDFFKEQPRPTMIDVAAMSSQDETALLAKGIKPEHLRRNFQKTLGGRHLDPLAFQLKAVGSRSISGVSPFSGKAVESSHSLLANINVICYRFQAEQVFYMCVANIGAGFEKSAIYFPESDTVVTDGDPWGLQVDDVIELKARVVSEAQSCYEYLSNANSRDRKLVVCLGFYHFAHHLWNELSGLQKLRKKGLLGKVDKFLVLREPLGPIGQIFPEIPADRIELQETTAKLFRQIVVENYFALRVGDTYIESDLTESVATVSAANCLPQTLATVQEAKAKYHPLLWVGIRVGNRSWVDQIEGLSKAITSLREQFPRLGVVFDGFSLPADAARASGGDQGFAEILRKETEVVDGILARLRQTRVDVGHFNIIGLGICDANVWAQAIDVYVSPHGSLQHKVGWFAKKAGIVHTNQTLLRNPANYVWTRVEGAIPPNYIDTAAVTDIRPQDGSWMAYNEIVDAGESGAGILSLNRERRVNPEFYNYSIEWEAARTMLLALLRSPSIKSSVARLILVARFKHKLVLAMRAISSMGG